MISDAFGEWDLRPRRSFADWQVETLERPGVDVTNFRVATYEGRIIGSCIVFDSGPEAWVSQLATERTHRGRGVAQQLLAETYAAARARGVPDGGLSTDTRTGALGLYERLGMEVRHTIDCWTLRWRGLMARRPSKHLRPARPLSTGHATSAVKTDGRWIVRSVSGAAAEKAYRCPGCQQLIPPGYAASGGLARSTGAAVGLGPGRAATLAHRCWDRRP